MLSPTSSIRPIEQQTHCLLFSSLLLLHFFYIINMMNYNNILSPPTTRRSSSFISRTITPIFPPHKKHLSSLVPLAAHPTTLNELGDNVEKRKHSLLEAIQDTQRGLVTTPLQRSSIQEALVSVESCNALGGISPIDLRKLDGTWRLQYTSASDVLVLLQSSSTFPFFQVGPIYQKFECRDQSNGGIVRNVVRWSIPDLLEEQEGATLLVSASFSVVSVRHIYLQFDEIAVQNINISEQLQALLTPALLPRSFLSLQILQFIRTFKAQIPVTQSGRRSAGGLYYLSYLDGDMLLGRADSGGVFVFTKSQPVF